MNKKDTEKWKKLMNEIEKIFHSNINKHINKKILIPLFKKYDFNYENAKWHNKFYKFIKQYKKSLRKNWKESKEMKYIVSGPTLRTFLKKTIKHYENENLFEGYALINDKETIEKFLEKAERQSHNKLKANQSILEKFNKFK